MDNFREFLKIENVDETRVKSIEINEHKTAHFIFHENQRIIKGKVTSASIKPEAMILEVDDEYYYYPINSHQINKRAVENFSKYLIKYYFKYF